MKRAFASVAGLVGLAALGRFIAKRRQPAESIISPIETTTAVAATTADAVPADSAADPAEELRRKLADAREAEPVTARPEGPAETLAERRARVHSKAREAIDSMGADSTGDGGAPV